ncbi:MAG TPA: lysylphosphatidylglycerol synthase domain-containing protein [Polyangiaceae bacterium]|nr:lysylphosphatidylglycerol synthase domain-containing protein [Polyangiaceae bacterium]
MTAEPASSSALGRAGRALSLLVGVACLAYFAREVYAQRAALGAVTWSGHFGLAFAAAVAVFFAGALQDGWAWGWLLRTLEVPARPRAALGVFAVAQFAKYLPGNVGQHVGRIELSRRQGWQLGRVAVSLLIENGFGVGGGALFAVLGIPGLDASFMSAKLASVGFLLVLGTVGGALAARWLLAEPPSVVRRWLKLDGDIRLQIPFLFTLLLSHLLSYAAVAAGLALLVIGAGSRLEPWLWQLPAIVAVSWLSGYLTPGAPAGLGVRELIVTRLLAPNTGTSIAVAVALSWRMVALASDLSMLGLGLLLRRRSR